MAAEVEYAAVPMLRLLSVEWRAIAVSRWCLTPSTTNSELTQANLETDHEMTLNTSKGQFMVDTRFQGPHQDLEKGEIEVFLN